MAISLQNAKGIQLILTPFKCSQYYLQCSKTHKIPAWPMESHLLQGFFFSSLPAISLHTLDGASSPASPSLLTDGCTPHRMDKEELRGRGWNTHLTPSKQSAGNCFRNTVTPRWCLGSNSTLPGPALPSPLWALICHFVEQQACSNCKPQTVLQLLPACTMAMRHYLEFTPAH